MGGIDAVETRAAFTAADLQGRLDNVRSSMEKLGAGLLIVTDQDDIFYLTGARELGGFMFCALLVPPSGPVTFVGRQVDALAFSQHTGIDSPFFYGDHQNPQDALFPALESYDYGGTEAVGLQLGSATFPVSIYRGLTGRWPGVRIEDATRVVWDFRKIKSAVEIGYMKEAATINRVALDRALGAMTAAATDSFVAAELFAGMLAAGSDPMTYFIVTSGPESAVAHATYDNRRLEKDDHVHFEFSGARFRYHAPLMRTAVLGRPSEAILRLHGGAEAGLEAALATIRAGVTSGEVHAATTRALVRHGVDMWKHHRTGYSVGIATGSHWPEGHIVALREGDPTVLEEDMVFHIPTVLFEPRVAGAGISETVRVTRGGVEVLTDYSRELLRV
jgi:Xaa-Pro dipeptidase